MPTAGLSTSAKKKLPAPAGLRRMSVTIPGPLLRSLDGMVGDGGYENRSQAVAEFIHERVALHQQDYSSAVMAGSITLFYDESKNNLLTRLAALQREHVAEVLSSLHVQLEENFRMEVILVQGPAQKLNQICQAFLALKGVRGGKLTLTEILIPPVHPRTAPALPSIVPDPPSAPATAIPSPQKPNRRRTAQTSPPSS